MKNSIKSQLTPDEREELKNLLSQIERILSGKLAALTREERKYYGSVNEKNKLLVNRVRDYRHGSPALSSPDIDWDEFEADYQAREFFEGLLSRFYNLVYNLESSKILHDYDNYNDSRKDYAYAQYKQSAEEPGFHDKVATLKQFFNRTGTSSGNKNKKNE